MQVVDGVELTKYMWQMAGEGVPYTPGVPGAPGQHWSGPVIQSTTYDDGASSHRW